MTQNNLANALGGQVRLAEGDERARLLGEAVASFRAALTVRTRDAAPADWAATQFNLALLYRDRAQDAADETTACGELAEARACAEAARSGFEAVGESEHQRWSVQLQGEIAEAMRERGCGAAG